MLNKTYPGVKALVNASFDLKKGEVHALIGENGAGKSTMIKVLMGIVNKDRGTIIFEKEPVDIKNAREANSLGINAVFQELSLIPTLSVAENIFISREITKANIFLNRKAMEKKARDLLKRYKIDIDPRCLIADLSIAKRQLVEIMKATATEPKILILDEPTSSLTEGEAETLFALIEDLKKEGTGIIYITHRMNEIFKIADRATILRDGANVAELDVANLTMDKVVKHMVGREIELYDLESKRKFKPDKDKPILEVQNLSQKNGFSNISLKLYRGEILGIAGLVGSGRTELMQAVFGIERYDSGKIFIEGKPVYIKSVKDALRHKMVMIPESRHQQGLILIHSVADNITLTVLKKLSSWGFLNKKKIARFADEKVGELSIKTDTRNKIVNFLSGGNQQKVVIAKCLSVEPKILIVDELTRGIDVHSKTEIHKIMRSLSEQGISIILISSEMPELLAHSDRILVMNDNRIIAELQDTDQEEIMSIIMKDKLVKTRKE